MNEYKDSEQEALEQMAEGPGRIEMADEVIQTITAMETLKVEGVLLPEYKSIFGGKKDLKDLSRTIQVNVRENHVTINISILVEYGLNIYDKSRALQRRVKNAVESMTGKIVDQVNVTVKGIQGTPAPEEPPDVEPPQEPDQSRKHEEES